MPKKHRIQYPVAPPHVEYSLTKLCQTFIPMIEQIVEWDGKYFEYTIPNNDLLGLLYTLIEPMVTRIVQSGSRSRCP